MSQQLKFEDLLRAAAELDAQPMPRSYFPSGHIIHMSLDHQDARQSFSVAECDCGWVHRIAWPGHHEAQDLAVETHWREVESRTCD